MKKVVFVFSLISVASVFASTQMSHAHESDIQAVTLRSGDIVQVKITGIPAENIYSHMTEAREFSRGNVSTRTGTQFKCKKIATDFNFTDFSFECETFVDSEGKSTSQP